MKIETKCDIGDSVFIVFGNPKKNIIVLEGTINKVSIFTGNNVMYGYVDARVVVDKESMMKNKDSMKFGFCYEKYLDPKTAIMSGNDINLYPTFTSKEKCIAYLRRVTQ